MGYGGLSCYDNQYFKTPEIDKLASQGLLLTDFHSNGAVCSPTRAALMTGRYQYRSGCHVVINADRKHKDHQRGMPDKEWTFAEALKQGGYATAIFGKWHLGYKQKFHPSIMDLISSMDSLAGTLMHIPTSTAWLLRIGGKTINYLMNPATTPISSPSTPSSSSEKTEINPSLFMLLMEHRIIPIRHEVPKSTRSGKRKSSPVGRTGHIFKRPQ